MTDIFRSDWIEMEQHTNREREILRYLVEIKKRHVAPEEAKRQPIPDEMLPKAGTQAAVMLDFVKAKLGRKPTLFGNNFDDLGLRVGGSMGWNHPILTEQYPSNATPSKVQAQYRMPLETYDAAPYLSSIYFKSVAKNSGRGHVSSICLDFHAEGACHDVHVSGEWVGFRIFREESLISNLLQCMQNGNLDLTTAIDAYRIEQGRKKPEDMAPAAA